MKEDQGRIIVNFKLNESISFSFIIKLFLIILLKWKNLEHIPTHKQESIYLYQHLLIKIYPLLSFYSIL